MKQILSILLVLFYSSTIQAQKKTVKEYFKLSANQSITLHLKFAEEIKLMQWDKNEIGITATVEIDKGEGNDAYSLKSLSSENSFEVKDEYGNYFETRKNKNTSIEINYVIYVPQNASLTVKSISGNLTAAAFQGKLKTDLVSGNVDIKKYQGSLELKTVSGNLDIVINKAEVDAKTVTGVIYSNIDIASEDKRNRGVGSHIKGQVNNGKDLLRLETVSGNIYMRKD